MPKSTRRRSRRSSRLTWGSTLTLLIVLLILVLSGALEQEAPASPTVIAEIPPMGDGWYSVYFTEPGSPAAAAFTGGPDQALAAAIGQAQQSIDAAVYDIDLASIVSILLSAQDRGVTLRVVTDSDYFDEDAVQQLRTGGVPVLGDRRESFMHNKFVVIDQQEVWTGSMNLTVNDAYRNNNNLIRIRSSRLAASYTAEFEEMFRDDLFGPAGRADTPNPTVTIDGTLLETYFSPDDGTAARLVELIQGARESIYFLAYSFTSDDLAAAMLERAEAGVTVAGVFEAAQVGSNIGTEFDHLLQEGLDVRLDGNPRNMHHKVLLIDGQTVVTGSYNFSANAENRNDENTLVIHDPQIAALYLAEFERVYGQAQR